MVKKNVFTKDMSRNQESFAEKIAFSVAKNLGSATSLMVHTVLFIGIFSMYWIGFSVEQILLILTTIVSLEAIYMSIFIQMTVNKQAAELTAVQEDIEDIQEDVEEISEDIEGIQEDVKEIGEDVDEISEDIEDIQEDVKEIGEDVEEISDDLEEDEKEVSQQNAMNTKLQKIEETLHRLLSDIEGLKK
jgi:uncharacterized protein YoxC